MLVYTDKVTKSLPFIVCHVRQVLLKLKMLKKLLKRCHWIENINSQQNTHSVITLSA